MESFVEHQPLEEFVINTTAFHNAHLLRRCLPRSAWAPVPMFTPDDRLIKHNELAEQLRGTHLTKKATAAAARAQKRKTRDEGLLDDAPVTKKRKQGARKKQKGGAGKAKAKGSKTKGTKEMVPHEESDTESSGQPGEDMSDEEETGSDAMDVDLEGDNSDDEEESSEEEYIARPTRRPRGQQAGPAAAA